MLHCFVRLFHILPYLLIPRDSAPYIMVYHQALEEIMILHVQFRLRFIICIPTNAVLPSQHVSLLQQDCPHLNCPHQCSRSSQMILTCNNSECYFPTASPSPFLKSPNKAFTLHQWELEQTMHPALHNFNMSDMIPKLILLSRRPWSHPSFCCYRQCTTPSTAGPKFASYSSLSSKGLP